MKSGLDFISYKPLKTCRLAGPRGVGNAAWHCWTEHPDRVLGKLAEEVTVPQYMGHKVIGDVVPAAGAFGNRM